MSEPLTDAALIARAWGRTTAAVERGTAILLGADPARAHAAVNALAAAGVLGDGLAVHALVIAARTGSDVSGAITALAAGERIGGSWSDYELRAAREEGEEELEVALRQPVGDEELRLDGPGAPEAVAGAVRSGRAGSIALNPLSGGQRGRDALPSVVEHIWAARLGRAWGCAVRPLRPEDAPVLAAEPPTGPDEELAGLDLPGTVRCSAAHVDLLASATPRQV
jgi:hypothetical protein